MSESTSVEDDLHSDARGHARGDARSDASGGAGGDASGGAGGDGVAMRGEHVRTGVREGHGLAIERRPRPAVWSLFTLLHAMVFALAGLYVPWDPWAPFAVSCHLLAALHVTSAATVWLARRGDQASLHTRILRTLGAASLLHLFVMTIVIARGMFLLVELYGDLGKGLAAAIAAAFCVEILFTLPVGCWAWALGRRRDDSSHAGAGLGSSRVTAAAGAVLLLLASAATLEPTFRARATRSARPVVAGEWADAANTTRDDEAAALTRLAAKHPKGARGLAAEERVVHTDATCSSAIDTPGLVTVFVAFATKPTDDSAPDTADATDAPRGRAKPRHLCVQASPDEVFDVLHVALKEAGATRPMRVDVVDGVRVLPGFDPLVRPFVLRPGLDGLCVGERCTTPWQLAARRAFISLTPVPTIPDLRMGVDLARFTGDREGPLRSFSTRAYLVQRDGEVVRTSRLVLAPQPHDADGAPSPRASEDTVAAAIELATTHIVRAQRDDGRFRYTIDPFRARRNDLGVNLPRQAGTTLVLCELADDEHLDVMRASLDYMASQAIESGDVTALVKQSSPAKPTPDASDDGENGEDDAGEPERPAPTLADLGSTALPAIAFLACRARTGPKHDAELVRMVRFLLAMQLPDGTFHPKWDLRAAAPQPGPHPLFAEGQAVYALGLAEQLAHAHPELGLDATTLHDAVERSLDHFSRDYWPRVLRDFFFVEENWHCLAARALLESHRHDGYERFCLDYVTFKRRLLLHEHDRVHEDFVGGYGFGNLVPPQSTPTAGLGEALAAAIAIARARGQDTAALEADLRLVHEFLLRQQIRRAQCFGCRNLTELEGGFSESMVSPGLRIDFTQHVLAALGHGRDVLEGDE